MGKTKKIGDKVHIEKDDDALYVTIIGREQKWKESLLMAWFLGFTICGLYVLLQLFGDHPGDRKVFFLVFLSFWAYFEYMSGYALLWRMFGKELIKVGGGSMILKDSIKGYGKAKEYFLDNIKDLGLLNINERSFKWQFESSYYVVGGERLGFKYQGRKVVLGKDLNEEEAKGLLKELSRGINEKKAGVGAGNTIEQ